MKLHKILGASVAGFALALAGASAACADYIDDVKCQLDPGSCVTDVETPGEIEDAIAGLFEDEEAPMPPKSGYEEWLDQQEAEDGMPPKSGYELWLDQQENKLPPLSGLEEYCITHPGDAVCGADGDEFDVSSLPPLSGLEIFCEKNPTDPVCGGEGPEVPDPNETVEDPAVEAPAEAAPAAAQLPVTGTSAAVLAGLALVLGLTGAGTAVVARRNA